MATEKKGYFGLDWIICLILAILPTNVILGIITRIMRKNVLGAVLNIIFAPVFYVIDLVTMIINKDITVLA